MHRTRWLTSLSKLHSRCLPCLRPITATNKSNYSKTADLVLSLLKKKSLPEWRPRKIIPLHYTSKTHPADFPLSSLSILQKKKKKNHLLHSLFLIAWPLACELLKGEKKKHAYWRGAFAQSSFIMYIYANGTLVYSRKSLSLLLSLPFGQCFQPAVCMMSNGRRGSWLVFTQTYMRGGSREVSLLFSDSPSKFKMKRCWVPQGFYSRSSGSLSLLTNSGCLLIRWTVYSYLIIRQYLYPSLSYYLHLAY